MNLRRFAIFIFAVLTFALVLAGYTLYLRNKEIASIQNSLISLSDSAQVAARQKNAMVVQGDPNEARLKLQTCGLIVSGQQFPTADEMNAVLPYVVRNEQVSTFIARGMEMTDACVDDSDSQRILFLGATLRRNGRSEATFGALDEAYPQLGTITTVPDGMNLLNAVSPAHCAILGNGAHPDSQFLVTCEETESQTNLVIQRGYVMDFVKRTSVEAYRCNDLQDDGCAISDRGAFTENKDYFDPGVVKKAH